MIENETLSEEQQKAFDIIEKTNSNLFIQGQAGTGKSSFILYLKKCLNKSMIICSPTAIAAMNVGGQTIHSFFNLPCNDFLIEKAILKTRKTTSEILKRTDLLVIDEISMVRPDILDGIDKIMKRIKQSKKPFGGIQILLIGDIYQLPPVIKSTTLELFKEEYNTKDPYFFDAHAYKDGNFKRIEFTTVYRQQNDDLIKNLIKLRSNEDINNAIEYFNSCKIKDKEILKTAVTITPYRSIAEEMNNTKLQTLSGNIKTYKAVMTGSFLKASTFPGEKELSLKEGALVMFNKNNEPEWRNGSTGIVTSLSDDCIFVKMLNSGRVVVVEKETWINREYSIVKNEKGKKEIIEKEIGEFKQYPLQLGYCLTIHKCQGKTLNKVSIDMGKGAFAHGQLYVALSRTRKKEDINLIKPISKTDSIISKRVVEFMKN